MSGPRSALVIGASGLVGRAVCAELVADPAYSGVHALVRRTVVGMDARIIGHAIDFERLDRMPWPATDDVYCCLGTTIRDAGSRAAFRKVDYDYVLDCARRAKASGSQRFALVSALGANPGARVFYSRTKGEVERDLRACGFLSLVIARPSFLAGERAALGQRDRTGESLALGLLRRFAAIVPERYRPVEAQVVAHALISTMKTSTMPVTVLESEAIQRLASPA